MAGYIALDDDFFTAEHDSFRDQVSRFVRERVDPHADEWNAAGILPRSVWRDMGSLGFLGTSYDEQYGGSNAGLLYAVILAEELTKSRVSGLSFAVLDHTDMSANYLLEGPKELRDKYLPGCVQGEIICGLGLTEPTGGSDVAAIKTTAVRDGDHYIINGQKVFITNGIAADIIIIVARTDPNPSRPHEGISLIAVPTDTPGFTRGAPLKKLGNLASDTAELFLSDVRVPVGNLLGGENKGWNILMADLGLERLIACAIYLSACEEMLHITNEYTRDRKVFGKSVSDFQTNAHRLAEMYTEVTMAKVFYRHVLKMQLRGMRTVKEVSMIKYYASELANRIAYLCLSLHGGWGYMKEYPISQWYTDVRLFNIGAGTTEIMKEIIAKEVLYRQRT
ncbi:MAG TPA: acyl-CoA dehydrogenase family protein [Sphingomicrobium sp.]|nr:acyl-CoA dehydrogenase family protein [Sphingomicrobium sp.]